MSQIPYNEETEAILTTIAAVATQAYGGNMDFTGDNLETSTTNAGALSVSIPLSRISSAGSESRTLAAPDAEGKIKVIHMTVDGGNVTLLGTNIWGQEAATGTFGDVGDHLVLLSVGAKWSILNNNGVTFA